MTARRGHQNSFGDHVDDIGVRTALSEGLELCDDDFGLVVEASLERREEVGAVKEVHREVGTKGRQSQF